jgi:hypothetical protein
MMENRTDYERKRSELNQRYANPEWMKDNVGWIIGAIAIVLVVGGIHYVSADYPKTAPIPDNTTTGQSTPPPMSSTPPVRLSPGL